MAGFYFGRLRQAVFFPRRLHMFLLSAKSTQKKVLFLEKHLYNNISKYIHILIFPRPSEKHTENLKVFLTSMNIFFQILYYDKTVLATYGSHVLCSVRFIYLKLCILVFKSIWYILRGYSTFQYIKCFL